MEDCPITGEIHCRCEQAVKNYYIALPRDTLRKLFTDHLFLMHLHAGAYLDNNPAAPFIEERLLENPKDIGDFLEQSLGVIDSEVFAELLTTHIQLSKKAVEAIKNGTDQLSPIEALQENAETIASTLSNIEDGTLTYEATLKEFNKHNDFDLELANLHAQKLFNAEIVAYDAAYCHILHLSDFLCYGLVPHEETAVQIAPQNKLIRSCNVTGESHCKCDSEEANYYIPLPRDTLRKLFTDHADYTYMFINASLNGSDAAPGLLARLLSNQIDIGDYLGKFVGNDNGKAITRLLTEHIKLAGDVVKAKIQNEDLVPSMTKLFANADDVAKGLASIQESTLNYDKVLEEFTHHDQFVIDLINSYGDNEYVENLVIYDRYYCHMLKFSDMICHGLIPHQ